VLARRLVGELGETADQLLEGVAHLLIGYDVRVEVDAGEFLGHLIEEACFRQPVDLGGEFETLEDVAHIGGEALDVTFEVLADVVRISHELSHVQG
jgi:hypothetical protein